MTEKKPINAARLHGPNASEDQIEMFTMIFGRDDTPLTVEAAVAAVKCIPGTVDRKDSLQSRPSEKEKGR